jgi:hypothetical protein
MPILLGRAALAVATAAGCTSGSSGGPTTATSQSVAPAANAVWQEFVTCAREHGQQTMPDPIVDGDGRATFPQADNFNEKDAYRAVRDTCGSILDRLPPQANPLGAAEITPELLDTLRRYVECLRGNGMPDMPDPGPNGEIREPDKYFRPPLQDTRNAARNVCDPILLEPTR